jgi:hypothetical protein
MYYLLSHLSVISEIHCIILSILSLLWWRRLIRGRLRKIIEWTIMVGETLVWSTLQLCQENGGYDTPGKNELRWSYLIKQYKKGIIYTIVKLGRQPITLTTSWCQMVPTSQYTVARGKVFAYVQISDGFLHVSLLLTWINMPKTQMWRLMIDDKRDLRLQHTLDIIEQVSWHNRRL